MDSPLFSPFFLDGQSSYVRSGFVRSSIDLCAGFSEDGKGGFQMDFVIAGD